MHREDINLFNADRYIFDFKYCRPSNGWAQIDTKNDAHYFGNWVNPFNKKIWSYIEGDVIMITCHTEEEFMRELTKHTADEDFIGIDALDKTKQKFIEMGLEDILH